MEAIDASPMAEEAQITVMADTEVPSLKASMAVSHSHNFPHAVADGDSPQKSFASRPQPSFGQPLPPPKVIALDEPAGRNLSEGVMADVEAADDSAALLGGTGGDENEEVAPLVTEEIFEVRLFDESEELRDHTSKSVYFLAMMKSMRTRSLLHWEVFAAVGTQIFQLVSLEEEEDARTLSPSPALVLIILLPHRGCHPGDASRIHLRLLRRPLGSSQLEHVGCHVSTSGSELVPPFAAAC